MGYLVHLSFCHGCYSSDEGEWLKALEDGEVDERGYLPKKKGQGNLTARQVSDLI